MSQPIILEFMTKTTITQYPDGKRYVKSQSWFVGEKMQGPQPQKPQVPQSTQGQEVLF